VATEKFKNKSKWFKRLLEKKLPGIECYDADTTKLDGESFYNTLEWAPIALQPIFNPQHKQVLNVTGGTKVLNFALEKSINWLQVHYTAWTNPSIEVWQYDEATKKINHNLPDNEKSVLPKGKLIDNFSIDDACLLHIDSIDKDKTSHFNPAFSKALPVMENIWSCLDEVNHPHRILAEHLATLWTSKPSKGDKELWVLYSWDKLGCTTETKNKMAQWGSLLSQLCNEIFKVDEQGIKVRSRVKGKQETKQTVKNIEAQRKWVLSDWLETFVAYWLSFSGILDQNIHKGMIIKTDKDSKEKQGSEREIDICILHKQAIYIIEIKAGFVNKAGFKEAVRQLASLNAITGAKRILFLGPWASKIYYEEEAENESLARGCNIKVITNKAALLENILK
jgi:hypothetical protein